MKVSVYLKDPDGFFESVQDAAKASVRSIEGISDDEKDAMAEHRVEAAQEFMKKRVEYGECVSILFDTDAGTAVVEERK
jgi:hypothetical protein